MSKGKGHWREDGERHVFVLLGEDLHVETPLGTFVFRVRPTSLRNFGFHGVVVDIEGQLIEGSVTTNARTFGGLAFHHNGGAWLQDWEDRSPEQHAERWRQTGGE